MSFMSVTGGIRGGRLAGRPEAAPVGPRGSPPTLAVTYLVVFLSGVWLFSAQTMVYAAVTSRYDTASRATAVGFTAAGMGRFGAVLGPWLGGQLMAGGNQGWGFTVFAGAALFAMVFVSLAGLRSTEQAVDPSRELVDAGH